jgi:glycine/D-amino acid oxidase-like deaminating enzyme
MRDGTKGTIVVVGGGLFGVTGALELQRRGWQVSLLDPGPLPRPEAASTDVSKIVRLDSRADELYTGLMEEALDRWVEWNRRWGESLYHEDGFLLMSREPMRAGGFEHDSFETLHRRGHRLERLDSSALAERHPAWAASAYPDGYYNPRGGWAESGRVVDRLLEEARREGVAVHEGTAFDCFLTEGSRVAGVLSTRGDRFPGDQVVVAAGAWTPYLLPRLAPIVKVVGQPVIHLRPEDSGSFRPPRFVPWGADVARTGWYGFPALWDGTVKVANHGAGREVHPDEPREVLPEEVECFREFLRGTFPVLADAPIAGTRLCLYGDTPDGNFLIDRDPDREGLVVAGGGSGHAFKFAPVLGGIVADAVEGGRDRFSGRFAWRSESSRVGDAARPSSQGNGDPDRP